MQLITKEQNKYRLQAHKRDMFYLLSFPMVCWYADYYNSSFCPNSIFCQFNAVSRATPQSLHRVYIHYDWKNIRTMYRLDRKIEKKIDRCHKKEDRWFKDISEVMLCTHKYAFQ